MGLFSDAVSSVYNIDKQVYSSLLNPTGYLNNSDAAYYVPWVGEGKSARENLNYQRQVQSYNQWLQQQVFAREDNSVQRRVADLKAAGLSPVLAAGQGAGTGGTVSISAPQRQSQSNLADAAMSLMRMDADISKTRAEEQYIKLQASKVPAEIKALGSQAVNAAASAYRTSQEARKTKIEADNATFTGQTGSSIFGKMFNDAAGVSNKAVQQLNKEQQLKSIPKTRSNFEPKQNLQQKLKELKERPLYEY